MIVNFAELSLWAGHRDNGFVHLLQALPQPQRFPHFQKRSLPQRSKKELSTQLMCYQGRV